MPERDGVGSHHIELLGKTRELTERTLRMKKEGQEQCCHLEGVGHGDGPGRTLGECEKGPAEPATSFCPSVLPKPSLVFTREEALCRESAT